MPHLLGLNKYHFSAGTRVESHLVYNLLSCRRIGDERLTFAEFSSSERKFMHQEEQYSGVVGDLFNKVSCAELTG